MKSSSDGKMVRLEPPSNVDNRRSLSERVSDFFDLLLGWDGVVQLLGGLAGLGFLGYIVSTWLRELILRGSYVSAGLLALTGIVLVTLSLARIPIAIIVLLGCSVVSAVAFFGGNLHLLLP